MLGETWWQRAPRETQLRKPLEPGKMSHPFGDERPIECAPRSAPAAWPRTCQETQRGRGDDSSSQPASFTVKAELTIHETRLAPLSFSLRLIQLFHWDCTLPRLCLLFLFHFPFVSRFRLSPPCYACCLHRFLTVQHFSSVRGLPGNWKQFKLRNLTPLNASDCRKGTLPLWK